MARCLVVYEDGTVYVDGVRQEWTLPVAEPAPMSDEEIERRLAAIYGTEEKGGS